MVSALSPTIDTASASMEFIGVCGSSTNLARYSALPIKPLTSRRNLLSIVDASWAVSFINRLCCNVPPAVSGTTSVQAPSAFFPRVCTKSIPALIGSLNERNPPASIHFCCCLVDRCEISFALMISRCKVAAAASKF